MEKHGLFTHLHVVPNLYDLLSSTEHKRKCFEECSSSEIQQLAEEQQEIEVIIY